MQQTKSTKRSPLPEVASLLNLLYGEKTLFEFPGWTASFRDVTDVNRQTTEATRVTRRRRARYCLPPPQGCHTRRPRKAGKLVEMESLFGKAVEVTLKNWNPLQVDSLFLFYQFACRL